MSWWRKEKEEQEMAEEEAKELEVAEEDTEEENIVSYSPLSPQTSSTEQVQELNKTEENWFWGWLSPFSLFSGLPTLADRKRPPGNTCSECEILFCRKCEGLHYNPGFIEHCILGHGREEPEGSGLISPILSADSINLAVAPGGTEDEEIKRK
ncbi:uncharacterized protein C17orf50 homolog [Malaclemys terrapin pileata]|uniref:uncharacterized protein C17orf50 homolog n=1 Tax=Malaclemys terrapin pileata TaxID=2991368 RepID=UPI0023A7D38C|nr:uncharacterized protein C17orf50 homolog [Malaclemys terrapin pileata]